MTLQLPYIGSSQLRHHVLERVNQIQMRRKFSGMKISAIEQVTGKCCKEKKSMKNNLIPWGRWFWSIRNKENIKTDRAKLEGRENKTTFSSGMYLQPARRHCQLAISCREKYVLATVLGGFIVKQSLLSSKNVPILGRTICTHPQEYINFRETYILGRLDKIKKESWIQEITGSQWKLCACRKLTSSHLEGFWGVSKVSPHNFARIIFNKMSQFLNLSKEEWLYIRYEQWQLYCFQCVFQLGLCSRKKIITCHFQTWYIPGKTWEWRFLTTQEYSIKRKIYSKNYLIIYNSPST